MIKYTTGDIFLSDANCLVNPVNCVGVMGKGLALEFKRHFPDMFLTYKSLCANNALTIGRVGFYAERNSSRRQSICFFPTKFHWRNPSTVEYIDQSLQAFIKYAPNFDVKSVAFPKVGCGEGGLKFDRQVKPLLEKYFLDDTRFDVTVYV